MPFLCRAVHWALLNTVRVPFQVAEPTGRLPWYAACSPLGLFLQGAYAAQFCAAHWALSDTVRVSFQTGSPLGASPLIPALQAAHWATSSLSTCVCYCVSYGAQAQWALLSCPISSSCIIETKVLSDNIQQ
ncbi:hypothetical protein BV25DRAFT_1828379 [Artomyces pyxidatus]|uniref:Uncharacterized protein n=1 Tax=Artomyces pyxidatus TaxID=48021 RepID=A0ACB8STY0_9AGAM|nr:hypothetical protein BV25DRAFT_1828379 [Artomyces pyxidatus]